MNIGRSKFPFAAILDKSGPSEGIALIKASEEIAEFYGMFV